MSAPLPPHVLAYVDELFAVPPPPLAPWQERVIQRQLGPRPQDPAQAAQQPQAA